MVDWFLLSLGAALLYGLHNVFTRLAAGRLPDAVGALALEGTAALGILAFALATRARFGEATPRGLVWSAAAGVCVAAGTVLFFAIFRRGGPLSVAGPLVVAGGVAVMAVAGLLFFREPLTLQRGAGLALALAGIALLR